jgi:hypothetical protein
LRIAPHSLLYRQMNSFNRVSIAVKTDSRDIRS